MKVKDLREANLWVKDRQPTLKDYQDEKCISAYRLIEEGKEYWLLIRNKRDQMIYEYLKSPDDYKTKERIFGASLEEGYADVGNMAYTEFVLQEPLIIEEKNHKRKLIVLVSNKNTENDKLLHSLSIKTRQESS